MRHLVKPALPIALSAVLSLALSGCGSPNDPGAGGVTRSEAQALNDAATMLDKQTPEPPVVEEQQAPSTPPPAAPPRK